jgi:hypothetical protein
LTVSRVVITVSNSLSSDHSECKGLCVLFRWVGRRADAAGIEVDEKHVDTTPKEVEDQICGSYDGEEFGETEVDQADKVVSE